MLEAIERLRNALNELEKRQAAHDLGVAIGTALGTSVGIWRSETQINSMSMAEMDAWADSCQAYLDEGETSEDV